MSPEPDPKTTKSEPTLTSLLISLWRHLTQRRQRQLGLLLVLMLVSAFSEVITLGAVLPFIGVLTAPDKVFSYPLVRGLGETMGITSPDQLVLPFTVFFFLATVLAGAVHLLQLWTNTRLSFSIGADLSIEVYRRTLYQPYKIHISRNSSEVMSAVTTKTGITALMIFWLLNLASSVVLLVTVTLVLVAINPTVVSLTIVALGGSYAMIIWISRGKLVANSEHIAIETTKLVKALQEGLGGIRDVLLNGTQPFYCDIYRSADLPLRRAQGSTIFIASSPRFVMETVGISLIVGLAYFVYRQTGGIASALPLLGALALGAQRLLPALQVIYNSWALIAGNQTALVEVIDLLNQPLSTEDLTPAPSALVLNEAICIKSVRFRYGHDGPWVLDGLDFVIPKGARVGFVGSTGSGKTTALDLLMGLLEPTEGRILVDGLPINGDRRRSWQKAIAHVPQSIFLADMTIAENIAFGVPLKTIDMDRVREASQQAQIAAFIESRPKAYNQLVGERGIRLSGGQRQRIGIARALYKQASILVFDEATSSLDNATEQAVMESIENLNRDLTILIIAHRLTTVQRCDQIIELAHGKVAAQGSYEELLRRSPSFRSMAMAVA